MNKELIFKHPASAKSWYRWETLFGGKGSDCTKCGACEDACPQELRVMQLLKDAAAKYE